MCNRFADPVCAAHEPALRAQLETAEHRVRDLTHQLAQVDQELQAVESADPGVLERFRGAHLARLRDERATKDDEKASAIVEWKALQLRHDQTAAGLSALKETLARDDLPAQRRNRLLARYRLAQSRREAALARWKASSAWAEERLRAAPAGTARFEKYRTMVIERRAAEHHVQWPAPTGPGRPAWERTAAAETLRALEHAGAPHPQVTFMLPAVIDALHRHPVRPNENPLLAAHYASLPAPLCPATITCQLHIAAHQSRPVQMTSAELIAATRADGQLVVDDDAAAPVHDVTAGERWATVPIVGPLQLVDQDRAPIGEPRTSGWILVREQDARLVITTDPLPDLTHTST